MGSSKFRSGRMTLFPAATLIRGAARVAIIFCLLLAGGSYAADDLSAGEQLRELYETEFAWRQGEMGKIRGASGDWVDAAQWPDVSAVAQARRLEYWEAALEQLARIPRDGLTREEVINAEVFEQIVSSLAADVRFRIYEAPLNSDTLFWTGLHPRTGGFDDAEAYQRYIDRLEDLPQDRGLGVSRHHVLEALLEEILLDRVGQLRRLAGPVTLEAVVVHEDLNPEPGRLVPELLGVKDRVVTPNQGQGPDDQRSRHVLSSGPP